MVSIKANILARHCHAILRQSVPELSRGLKESTDLEHSIKSNENTFKKSLDKFIANELGMDYPTIERCCSDVERDKSKQKIKHKMAGGGSSSFKYVPTESCKTQYDVYSKVQNLRNAINWANNDLMSEDATYRVHIDQYVESCMNYCGVYASNLNDKSVYFRHVTPYGAYGDPTAVFESGFTQRILSPEEGHRLGVVSGLNIPRVITDDKEKKFFGWTKGMLVSSSADLKHVAARDFNALGSSPTPQSAYIYLVVPHKVFSVGAAIYEGSGKDYRDNSGDAEGAMEYVASYIAPDEVLGCFALNALEEIVGYKLNPAYPNAETKFSMLCAENAEMQKLMKSNSVLDVKAQHFYETTERGETYTEPRVGEKMEVLKSLLVAQLPEKRGGAYRAQDEQSAANKTHIKELMNIPSDRYDQVNYFAKDKAKDREEWQLRMMKSKHNISVSKSNVAKFKEKFERNRVLQSSGSGYTKEMGDTDQHSKTKRSHNQHNSGARGL